MNKIVEKNIQVNKKLNSNFQVNKKPNKCLKFNGIYFLRPLKFMI